MKAAAVSGKHHHVQQSVGSHVFDVIIHVVLIIVGLLCLLPFLHVAAMSLSSNGAVISQKVFFLPVEFSVEGYRMVVQDPSMMRSLGMTVLVTVAFTALGMLLSVLAAYPLTKKNLKGRGFFAFLYMFTMYFGGGLIPTYLVINAYGMLDTFWVMVIPGAISTYNMIIMRTFFQGIPVELEEAATIDGCNDIQTLWKVILPLSTASLMTIGMFYAVGHWNAWFNAVIYLRDSGRFPVQLWLRTIVLQNQVRDLMEGSGAVDVEAESLVADTIKFAVIVVAVLPILCVYPFVQKYFVKGVMVGSVKG